MYLVFFSFVSQTLRIVYHRCAVSIGLYQDSQTLRFRLPVDPIKIGGSSFIYRVQIVHREPDDGNCKIKVSYIKMGRYKNDPLLFSASAGSK